MLELKLRGGVWYVMGTVRNLDGKSVQVRRSTGFGAHQKAMADLRLSQMLSEAVKGPDPEKLKGMETVSQLIRIYAAKPGGMGETNAKHLGAFEVLHGGRRLNELTQKMINDWGYQPGHSPDYVRRRMAAVNTMLSYCREYGVEVPSGLKGKLPPMTAGRRRYLTVGERDAFIERMGEEGTYFRALTVFLFFTGARVGEALKLKWRDVDEAMEQAVVSSRKGRYRVEKPRPVPLIPEVLEELAKLGRRNEFVFSMVGAKALSYGAFHKSWRRVCKALKVEDFRVHDARHTFASLLGQTGEVELQEIQELLGHESIQMTLRYKHLLPGKAMKSVKALSSKFVELHKTSTVDGENHLLRDVNQRVLSN